MDHFRKVSVCRRNSGCWLFGRGASPALLVLVGAFGLRAADHPQVADLLRDASAAEARLDPQAALEFYLEADAAQPGEAMILQKISRQYSDLTVDAASTAEKKRLGLAALDYSQRAVALQPEHALYLVSLAICHGKLGELSNPRERVEHSRLVRQYVEHALTLDPDDDYAHHVLGRWHYEVASLDAASRLVVRVVYGGLPKASTAEAVRLLQRATELAPDVPGHRFELGFALLADGQRKAARLALEQALALPQREKYEDESRARARDTLARLRRE